MDPDVQAAIQAAALAGNYAVGAEIATYHKLTGICLHCVTTVATTAFATWPVCTDCKTRLDPVLTYRPGGPADVNVFNDWSQLMKAVRDSQGDTRIQTIVFDDEHHACLQVPPGTWDMFGVEIRGTRPTQQVHITFSGGAQLQAVRAVRDLSITNHNQTKAAIEVAPGARFAVG